jgi:predicted Ser/Thr protein kinase
MPYVTPCPSCQLAMQLADDAAGKPFRCPACKTVFVAPPPPVKVASAATAAPPVRQGAAGAASPPPPRSGASAAPKPPAASVASAPPATAQSAALTSGTPSALKSPAPSSGPPKHCPACGSPWLADAVSCMDCGYLLPTEQTVESEEAVVVCINPACGAANPTGQRYCSRCTTVLPTAAGTVLHGRYKIKKLLAMGGFGAVYQAEDLKHPGSDVAIKDMICPEASEYAIRLNFFRREAEILRSLASTPIVPRLIDLIEQDKTAQLIMEFIPGQDLMKIQEANGHKPFAFDQVVEWGKAICEVLQRMHMQTPPLVHRDLKPENIMLRPDGRSIALIDFGTARDLGRTAKEQMKAKTRVYTEGYAPPEQIIGKPEPRSDLFALAGTLYQLLTGKEPEGTFTGKEIEALLAQPNALPAEQRWLYELIRINLAEDVHDRYHSAAEVKRDLERRTVTREVDCPQCGARNLVREPYCRQCAAPLTAETPPCHHCGQINRMGSRFCIYCGNRMR